MAWFAAAVPYISAASTALAVGAQYQQGKNQKASLEMQARADAEDAKAVQAEAQREAEGERKKGRVVASRARAVAAASGAGAQDETVNDILTDIETQGELNALNSMYSGNTQARGLRSNASARRREGRASAYAGNIGAASTALAGGTSWAQKYAT